MTCDEVRALYSELADAALTADTQAAVAAHLARCVDCRREWESFQRMLALLHEMPRVPAPEGFVDRVVSATQRVTSPRRVRRALFVPMRVKLPLQAAAMLAVVIGAVYLAQRPPEIQQVAQGPAPEPEPAPPPRAIVSPEPEPEAPQKVADIEPPAESPAPAPRPVPAPLRRREPERGQQLVAERPAQLARPHAVPWPGARTSAAPTISGHLAVRDPRTAEQALTDLLRRVGAVEVRRNVADDLTAVELEMTRGGWPEFVHGLGNIGAWAPDAEPEDLPQRVVVIVRMRR